jgi:ribosomal protein L1
LNEYEPQVISIEKAIEYHRELAKEDMLDNMNGFLHVKMVLDMKSKKKGKFMENIKGSVYYPHFFQDGIKKEVIAICKNENEIAESKEAGALLSGYKDILQQFEKGEISEQMYDFLVCTPEVFSDVLLLKKKIHKDKFPAVKTNTVTDNIVDIVRRLNLSKDYESVKNSDEKAFLKVKIGKLNFGTEELIENLQNLVKQVLEHKKFDSENFIRDCVLYAPPSTEKFKIDITRFNEKIDEQTKVNTEEAEE